MKVAQSEQALNLLHQVKAICVLSEQGWHHCQDMIFEKKGKYYDLSQADLELIPTIEKEGLFLLKTITSH